MGHARVQLRRGWAAGAAQAALLVAASPAGAFPVPERGARPGPPLLYAPLARAPQLQNAPRSVWHAAPILISGAEAYRRHEFLYQGFLYDDHGAHEQLDPNDPRISSATFSQPNGTYTYPTDPAYAGNAADLVEFRVKPLRAATAFRVTLNSMKDPTLIAFTLALGGQDGVTRAFPYGANVSAPADAFLTVHPDAAGKALIGEVRAAASGRTLGAAAVVVDRTRRQIDVKVPHSAWNPRRHIVRMSLGVGLWDKAAGKYLLPGASAAATTPGGAGNASAPAAFFDTAFRTHEPMTDLHELGSVPTTAQDPHWWRDSDQGKALAANDLSTLAALVDFAKLARGATDNRAVPRTGPMDRIMASRFEPAQGYNSAATCAPGSAGCAYQGNLQPYAVYVPTKPAPKAGYGLTLLLHALLTNYNLYLSSRNQSELGEAGPGSIVITPEGRGPDGSYAGLSGADVIEAMADAASHYRIDPRRIAVSGYSMGGIGTFQFGEEFPDLFGRAFSISGTDDTGHPENLRNLPVLMWNMVADEEVPIDGPEQTAMNLDKLGYRYELDEFAPGEHNSFALNDEYGPAAAFLGHSVTDPDPAHVTYTYDPALDSRALGYVTDHAYWVTHVTPRTAGSTGSVDAVSGGFGAGDPTPSGTQRGAGTLAGGLIPAIGYVSQAQTWGAVPATPRTDKLKLTLTGVSSLTVDVRRAHLDCNAAVDLESDGPATVTFAGCPRRVSAP